jgi:hypothetical protein
MADCASLADFWTSLAARRKAGWDELRDMGSTTRKDVRRKE